MIHKAYMLAFLIFLPNPILIGGINDILLENEDQDVVNVIGENFLILQTLKSFPAEDSETRFSEGGISWGFRYRHNFDDRWLMGIGFEQQEVRINANKELMFLKTLNHEALYLLRIWHPAYFGMGPTFRYFIPSRKGGFIFKRDDEYRVEYGLGLMANVFYKFSSRFTMGASVERWRGINTNRFHFWNFAIYAAYQIK